MNRKDFLKNVAIAAVAIALPLPAITEGVSAEQVSNLTAINRKRLLGYIKKNLAIYVESLELEPYDKTLFQTVTRDITTFMKELKDKKAITNYHVLCDIRNNPPDGTFNIELAYRYADIETYCKATTYLEPAKFE